MRRVIHVVVVLLVVMSLYGCKRQSAPLNLPPSVQVGGTYYTQFVIRYEKGRHRTTNYRRGASIPVNTPVVLEDINEKFITVKLQPSGQELLVENVKKHTHDDVAQAFNKLFAKTRVNLSQFNKLERDNIKNGTVAKGMRKKAVLVAIGYPPAIETMSLDSDQWTYWSSRFNKFIVYFRNGKVYKIVD